jgi:predicted restriction endonuclease
VTYSRIIRDTKRADHVKSMHGYRCQIKGCRSRIILTDGSLYAEGHHVKPLGRKHKGPDIESNILCLCPNHNAACDLGAIRLTQTVLRAVNGHSVAQKFLDHHNHRIYGKNRG